MNALYEPLIERDLPRIPDAIRQFRKSHTSDELFLAIARFALLCYAPSEHAKHALLSCLSTHELGDELGQRFDEAVTECAIYAASSRLPWSEPPMMELPAILPDQRRDLQELLAAIRARDRHRGERWLASRATDVTLVCDYFAAAASDFTNLGHKLIIALAAWKLVPILGEQGRYATLRTGIWEMTAYAGDGDDRSDEESLSCEILFERLIAKAVRERGDLESLHAIFLLDAALEASSLASDEGILLRARSYLTSVVQKEVTSEESVDRGDAAPPLIPIYKLGRDYGSCLKSFVVARRLHHRFPGLQTQRLVSAACYNLDHGPSFEAWSFA